MGCRVKDRKVCIVDENWTLDVAYTFFHCTPDSLSQLG